jgi:hypothetical protein
MIKLVVFIPEHAKELVKNALFEAGAGSLGAYSHCAWETLGTGQFLPDQTAIPHIGKSGELTRVAEWRVEMLVPEDALSAVKEALYRAHPYEEPAFDMIRVEDVMPRT